MNDQRRNAFRREPFLVGLMGCFDVSLFSPLSVCVAADIPVVFLLILLGSNISDDDRAMTFPPKEISYPEYKIKT